MDLEVETPASASSVSVPGEKKKTSSKARRSQTISKIATKGAKLLTVIQGDLDESKFQSKGAERAVRKYKKELDAMLGLVRRVNTDTKPPIRTGLSGFEKPYGITPALTEFFGWQKDATMSRIEVNSALCNYIKEMNLQNPENRRMIQPNAALKALFHREEDFNYAQMQGFISHLLVPLPTPPPESVLQ